ncbi:DUF1697 domain-containing protein [Massilia terrae]|uniref:DUF1697 domain-containing protein n=1 Tax=Massilia terrae TaxID=1811224 RepID=A0ABT2CWY4_9BURK|nr:DUF1697 domain-containing protein [Massilia terrae]MCS0658484.1 DUF1697 domain-containing protein [Massilia terrae]
MAKKHYIALLRGINVGRAKRVPMADLCQLVAELGFGDVRSILNSGNVVFSGPAKKPAAVATAIEEALVLRLGVASRVIVLDHDELAGIIDANTLVEHATDFSRLLVFVLEQPELRALLVPLAERDWGKEALALGDRAAYVWCPAGVLDSAVAAAVGKQLGDKTTSRNWNTLSKLHVLCSERAKM